MLRLIAPLTLVSLALAACGDDGQNTSATGLTTADTPRRDGGVRADLDADRSRHAVQETDGDA